MRKAFLRKYRNLFNPRALMINFPKDKDFFNLVARKFDLLKYNNFFRGENGGDFTNKVAIL